MIRTNKHLSTFSSGINQDVSVNKTTNTFYYDADNMRIISEDSSSSGALSNVKGNTLRLTFPVNSVIIGFCKIRNTTTYDSSKDAIVFFVYNTTSRIYLFEGDPYLVGENVDMTGAFDAHSYGSYAYKSGLLYEKSELNFSTSYPIKAEGRYESADIRKVYWVDGLNNMRYMIIDRVATTDPVTIFDINPTATLIEPVVSLINGGSYQAGMVQYSYQLYIKNGAATTFSPPSKMLYLTGNDGGADSRTFAGSKLGDNTGKAVEIKLTNLDDSYNRVRVVAIHYTEPLVNPTINIIGEMEFDSTYAVMVDNGYSIYGTIPIEEFRLFGQTNYIPNTIASKNNYLFLGDVIEDKWNPVWLDPTDSTFWDSRAVRYKVADSNAVVYDSVDAPVTISVPTSAIVPADWVTAGWDHYTYDYDGANYYNNLDNDASTTYKYNYQSNLSTIGAEGPNVKISVTQETLLINANTTATYTYIPYPSINSPATTWHRSSQRTEVYRMYVVFYNKKMQYSTPQWIIDFRMPSNDEIVTVNTGNATYLYPTVELRNLPIDTDLYGWQIFRCERGSTDRSVLASGVVSNTQVTNFGTGYTAMVRPFSKLLAPTPFIKAEDSVIGSMNYIVEMVSPEISFNKNIVSVAGDQLRIDGRYAELYSQNPTDADGGNARISTTVLGRTKARDVSDGILYQINEGYFQSFAIIHSDPATYPAAQNIGGQTYYHVTRYDDGSNHLHGNHGSAYVVVLDTGLSIAAATTGFLYGSYVRNVYNTQYGGHTYEARSYNSVIPYSDIIPKTTLTTTCYYGDTHISYFAYLRSSVPDINYTTGIIAQQEMVYIPCESSINCFYRLDQVQKYYYPTRQGYQLQETLEQGMVLQPVNYPIELGDLYRYNPVYSRSGNAKLLQNIVFDSSTIEHSDVKVMATGKKINNEYFDNWTNLYTNNYIEVDPRYGAIRNIFTFNNKLFAGQDKGIAILAVEDRSMIQDNSQLQLTLGTGGVLSRYDYLVTTSGFQNYFDMVLSDKTFYYLDRRNKIIYMMTEEGEKPISEIGGYRSFLKSHAKITTVKTGFDPVYKDVFFYITDGTIIKNSVINEYTSSFIGKHTFIPDRMLHLNDQFYSIKDNTMYLHNYGNYGQFYGTTSDSTLTTVINPGGTNVNVFDVVELRVDVTSGNTYYNEQFDYMDVNNNYQTISKALIFSGDDSSEDTTKSLIRKWRTQLIPDDDATDFSRLVDTYIKIKLTRHNTGNKKILLHDITSYTRPTKG